MPVSYRVSCSSQATLQECNIYGYRPSLRIPGGVVCRPNVVEMQSKYSGILKQPRVLNTIDRAITSTAWYGLKCLVGLIHAFENGVMLPLT